MFVCLSNVDGTYAPPEVATEHKTDELEIITNEKYARTTVTAAKTTDIRCGL